MNSSYPLNKFYQLDSLSQLESIYLVIAIINAVFWATYGVELLRGIKTMTVLKDSEEGHKLKKYPLLSVIIPACNEEKFIEESIKSVLGQDYPNLEIIVVNDRSGDQTGDILEKLKANHSNLRVLHIEALPEGWLGKNHALYSGAMQAKGEWLLFTDAGIHFSPDCIKTAVGYAGSKELDHLTLIPEMVAKGMLLKSFAAGCSVIFGLFQRPWRASNPRAREHMGIGAFNLIRRSVYLDTGTHRAIALRPDDGLKLGKLVKKNGFKQEAVYGTGLLKVERYRSLAEAIRGLDKNAFAGLNYRLSMVVSGAVMLFLTNIFPFVGFVTSSGLIKLVYFLSFHFVILIYGVSAKYLKTPLGYSVLHPLSVMLFIYVLLQSAFTTLVKGGIEWRGTITR